MALVDPLMVIDVGAWLSFGATLGILVLTGPILALVPWQTLPARLRAVARPLAVLVAATVAAELVLLPVSASVFGRVTSAGLVLNLIAIPAMTVVQISGLLIVAIGPVLTGAGTITWAASIGMASPATPSG